jgi:Contact-dependent growth inhibition CdiA C-terminal domain
MARRSLLEAGVSRDRPDHPGSQELPRPGSREELRQRLERLPPSHPSSPRYEGGHARQERLRVADTPTSATATETADRNDGHRTERRWPASERPEWQRPLERGEVDRVGLGIVDERARRFPPRERQVADYLAAEGSAVVARREDPAMRRRQPDADVDGLATEFKSLDPDPGHSTVKQALKRGIGQASHIVVDGRDSGLSQGDAHRGLARFLGTPEGRSFASIRLVGEDFDINWKRDDIHGPDH